MSDEDKVTAEDVYWALLQKMNSAECDAKQARKIAELLFLRLEGPPPSVNVRMVGGPPETVEE